MSNFCKKGPPFRYPYGCSFSLLPDIWPPNCQNSSINRSCKHRCHLNRHPLPALVLTEDIKLHLVPSRLFVLAFFHCPPWKCEIRANFIYNYRFTWRCCQSRSVYTLQDKKVSCLYLLSFCCTHRLAKCDGGATKMLPSEDTVPKAVFTPLCCKNFQSR